MVLQQQDICRQLKDRLEVVTEEGLRNEKIVADMVKDSIETSE